MGILGSALLLGLVACTGPELAGAQPLNTDPVTDVGPEVCSLLPRTAIAHMTARAEENLISVGEIAVAPNVDRSQCEVLVSENAERQTVVSLRIDADQVGAITRINTATEVAKERAARAPLSNPVRTGTDNKPDISLAITCGKRAVHIGIEITGYDVRRKTIDQDLADLSGIVAAKYGDRTGCRAEVAPPLAEEARGSVRMMAGNGGAGVPSGRSPGPSTSIGHVEALTTAPDGSVYFVGRKYDDSVNLRNADEDGGRWGETMRIARIRPDGVVEVVWDPNLAPFSTNNDPVAGDISEKLRLQGGDTSGSVNRIVLNKDQVWLLPAGTSSRPGESRLSRPVRIVQLTGGRAVDLRAIKAPVGEDSTRVKDKNGQPVPDGVNVWNTAQFSALTFDGDTPVLLDATQARVWRIDALRDGKVLDATMLPIGAEVASGTEATGLAGGRFAVSTQQGGLAFLDSRGRMILSAPAVNAEVDGAGPCPLELGRRQIAAAGDDVVVHAIASQVSAPAVVRVDSETGVVKTIQVSGYPGPRDPASDVATTRFAKSFGTAAHATTMFSTGWPVSALGAVGQNVLMAPFGTRILYELVPRG
ncbi:hypothetical protein LWC34_33360 [Kibdelosporangium philippinense]|uniref:Uncharacterized protein n=1 Tax=Kibdelosporangium philippinense TaxID=211113 RepID=A0ABS8ZM35_9PSEU|nr:hypothetical protein [Kibdelosporangium philippinense]MCE7007676.1 hypothetical protein [Kibdelosporangium philippinense]